MRWNRGAMAVAALAWAAGLVGSDALAGRPGGGSPPPPTGTIYVRIEASDTYPPGNYVMAPDGSGKTPVPSTSRRMLPSHALHGGHRWFLEARDLDRRLDAYGRLVFALVAVRGDGARVVRLTTDPNMAVRRELEAIAAWLPGDPAVSWVGHHLDANGAPVGGGIFVADLVFDAYGEVAGLATLPTAPAVPVAFTPTGPPRVNVFALAWSSDGGRLAYDLFNQGNQPGNGRTLVIADVAAETQSVALGQADGYAGGAAWSPVADRIAFTQQVFGGTDVATVSPDGSGLVVHFSATGTQQYDDPSWSPNGAHLILRRTTSTNSTPGWGTTWSTDVLRFDFSSGKATVLTGDLGSKQTRGAAPHAWR